LRNHITNHPVLSASKITKNFAETLFCSEKDQNPLIIRPYAHQSHTKLSTIDQAVFQLVERWNTQNANHQFARTGADGRTYSRCKYKDIAKQLNLTVDQVSYSCKKLQKKCLLMARRWNYLKADKTLWFHANVKLYKKTLAVMKRGEAKNKRTRAENAKSKQQWKRLPNLPLKILDMLYRCQNANRYIDLETGLSHARLSYRKIAQGLGVSVAAVQYWMNKIREHAEEIGITFRSQMNTRKRKDGDRSLWIRLDSDYKKAARIALKLKSKPYSKSTVPVKTEPLLAKANRIYTNPDVQLLLKRIKPGAIQTYELEHGISYWNMLDSDQKAKVSNPLGFIIAAGRNTYTMCSYGSKHLTELTRLRKITNRISTGKFTTEEIRLIKYKCPYTNTKQRMSHRKSQGAPSSMITPFRPSSRKVLFHADLSRSEEKVILKDFFSQFEHHLSPENQEHYHGLDQDFESASVADCPEVIQIMPRDMEVIQDAAYIPMSASLGLNGYSSRASRSRFLYPPRTSGY